MLARSLTAVVPLLVFYCSRVFSSSTGKVFEVDHIDGADDTPALLAGIANYTQGATIVFKKGITYNIFTPVKFPTLSNVVIKIEGNLTYPTSISDVQGMYDHIRGT